MTDHSTLEFVVVVVAVADATITTCFLYKETWPKHEKI